MGETLDIEPDTQVINNGIDGDVLRPCRCPSSYQLRPFRYQHARVFFHRSGSIITQEVTGYHLGSLFLLSSALAGWGDSGFCILQLSEGKVASVEVHVASISGKAEGCVRSVGLWEVYYAR